MTPSLPPTPPAPETDRELLIREQSFHDKWASGMNPDDVLVRESFEACTAPENRYILDLLGDIQGKRILDLGCGLGEGAVYFAMKGARVTACDLSPGMLDLAANVAARHGVAIATHQSSADATGLADGSFDVVYAANILHHSDIPKVLDEARRLLVPGGVLVSWDPILHNPLIKVYRRLAQAVRTIDEHPLKMSEIRLFEERFAEVKVRTFWLFTLLVFLRFYFWERVHPSKERYWKKILVESERLKSFYEPLERMDQWILAHLPWLKRYCWNIVVFCRR